MGATVGDNVWAVAGRAVGSMVGADGVLVSELLVSELMWALLSGMRWVLLSELPSVLRSELMWVVDVGVAVVSSVVVGGGRRW